MTTTSDVYDGNARFYTIAYVLEDTETGQSWQHEVIIPARSFAEATEAFRTGRIARMNASRKRPLSLRIARVSN